MDFRKSIGRQIGAAKGSCSMPSNTPTSVDFGKKARLPASLPLPAIRWKKPRGSTNANQRPCLSHLPVNLGLFWDTTGIYFTRFRAELQYAWNCCVFQTNGMWKKRLTLGASLQQDVWCARRRLQAWGEEWNPIGCLWKWFVRVRANRNEGWMDAWMDMD
jgi:hypothetical protein